MAYSRKVWEDFVGGLENGKGIPSLLQEPNKAKKFIDIVNLMSDDPSANGVRDSIPSAVNVLLLNLISADKSSPNLAPLLQTLQVLVGLGLDLKCPEVLKVIMEACLEHKLHDSFIRSLIVSEIIKWHKDSIHLLDVAVWSRYLQGELLSAKSVLPAISHIVTSLLLSEYKAEIAALISTVLEELLHSNSPSILPVLTGLADVIFPDGKTSEIALPAYFWDFIQSQISSSDPLTRKRCQYLAKRGYVKKGERWDDILLTLEVLEEKQTHIIKPILARFEKVAVDNSDRELYRWILAVFGRMVKHENQQVVKWVLLTTFRMDFKSFGEAGHVFILKTILPALNDSSLFMKSRDGARIDQLSTLGENCGDFFANLHMVISREELPQFHRHLLRSISEINWNSVSLFHVMRGLAQSDPIEAWDTEGIQILRDLLSGTYTHEKLIRAATHCQIQKCIERLTEKDVDPLRLYSVLATFSKNESLIRETNLYLDFADFLVQFSEGFPQNEFSRNCYSVRDCLIPARFIVITLDAMTTEKFGFISSKLEEVMSCLKDVSVRPYANVEKVRSAVNMSTALLQELQSIYTTDGMDYAGNSGPKDVKTKKNEREKTPEQGVNEAIGGSGAELGLSSAANPNMRRSTDSANVAIRSTNEAVLSFLKPYVDEVLDFVLREVEALSTLPDYPAVDSSLSAFEAFIKAFGVFERRAEFYKVSLRLIQSQALSSRYAGVSVLLLIFDETMDYNDIFHIILTRGYLSEKLVREEGSTRDIQANWSILVSAYTKVLWELVGKMSAVYEVDADKLAYLALDSVETTNWTSLASVLAIIGQLLPSLKNPAEFLQQFVPVAKSACFENRKSDLFWKCIDAFTHILFQERVMKRPELHLLLLQLVDDFRTQGEETNGLFNYVVDKCCDVWSESKATMATFVPLITSAVTFGDVFRKDRKLLYDVCMYIQAIEDFPPNLNVKSTHDDDRKVRTRIVSLLLTLDPSSENDRQVAAQIVEALMEADEAQLEGKSRYYGNSMTHRAGNRIWQGILLLVNFLDEAKQKKLLSSIINQLVRGNPQPSIRLLQEWVCVLVVLGSSALEEDLWAAERKAVTQRAGSIVSFIAIGLHLVRASSESDQAEAIADRVLCRLIPWNMAQHFTPRIYAKAAFEEVWKILHSLNFTSLLEKYKTTYNLMALVPEMGNSTRALEKLKNDFYLKSLHHVKDLTAETIYREIPRLTHLQEDELIAPEMFTLLGQKTHIPLRNHSDHLRNASPAEWVAKAAGMPVPGLDDTSVDNELPFNIQKKITPWKSMLPDLEAMSLLAKKKQQSDGLVVVASLIDKPTNLGGLCRTCEVLGASEYVLQSLSFIEDKNFSALSVSAEKWIPLKEVRVHELTAYLDFMKANGYTVVGAEQASNSVSLTDYKFPQKTLLLLGNEKEGLPVHLIQQLDVCVEAPQAGLIRSMNVHVTGALFIWEYSKQHILI